MLNLLGFRLHPAVGLVGGPALIAIGIVASIPALGLVGAIMLLATAWRWFGPRWSKHPRSSVTGSR
jgi:hypothetical protein